MFKRAAGDGPRKTERPQPFRRVLVANRGEIACRVIRALDALGIESVAVYSDADAAALHARRATQRVRLGPSEPSRSYLNQRLILDAAKKTGAEAIHPGYGFLSENADFAQAVIAAGIQWIGPKPEAMRLLGGKVPAREFAKKHGVPTAPGTGVLRDAKEAAKAAQDIGYPVLLKASSGGGGIGMKIVRRREEMDAQFEAASSVAKSAFGDGAVFMEKYIERPRHIELQVIGDEHGNLVHVGERECSIQRRHQKLVEESPSPALTDKERKAFGEMGVKFARAAQYTNAGTLEFLYQDGKFYFNEVNARLQVEHPVSEEVYGVDLVQAQIKVAAGETLPWTQDELVPRGHAIELRLNAEDPLNEFRPTPGPLRAFHFPTMPDVRVDTGYEPGARVHAQYDSLIAKVIAKRPTREDAIKKLVLALDQTRVEGTTTNLRFHRALMLDEAFTKGDLSTRFLEERPLLETLRKAHAHARTKAMVLAAALASAPRGGLGVLHHRHNLPKKLEARP
jgi:pyruvate carboxylase subunit A